MRDHGLTLFTKLKRDMHTNQPVLAMDAFFLRKRSIVETIINQLKNISEIEHSRHRSPVKFVVNLICGLIACAHQPKKPSLGVMTNELV